MDHERLKAYAAGVEEISLVYLFGSVARGDERDSSDIDIAVVGPISADREITIAADVIAIVGPKADVVFMKGASPLLRHRVIRDGKILYARSELDRVRFHFETLRLYFDTRPLREMRRIALAKAFP